MANNLYITTTEAKSGKSAIVLGIMQLLLQHLGKVAIFRPVISNINPKQRDHDINLILENFNLNIPYEDTYACSFKEARELISQHKNSVLIEKIISKYNALKEKYDFVLCEGTDFLSNDSAFELEMNAEIAANLDAPVALVINGFNKSEEEIIEATPANIDMLNAKGLDVVSVFINRATFCVFDKSDSVNAFRQCASLKDKLVYILEEEPLLGKPSMRDLQKWLNAEVLYGESHLDTPINDYIIAAMQANNTLNYLEQGLLVITPGDRMDIILTCLASRFTATYPNISGLLLTGGFKLQPAVKRLLDGMHSLPMPILSVQQHTYRTLTTLLELYGAIEPHDRRKINTALALFERNVAAQEMVDKLISRSSTKITPMMFEFKLLERAKKHQMRIVLPEGEEDRILRASEMLCQRGVAKIILLGNEQKIRRKIAALDLSVPCIEIIEPTSSPLYADYVQTYYEMRQKKGITMDEARDRMADNTYFGTMMVYKDHADGMVSGSINTTAHTIRPSFEIIKTKPGASIVSSIFLMCLKDRVLAFGDCAVNTNPTAAQLADIAISSAETARIFGITPRVAMLSYSTGTSGTGVDVDKVAEATKLAKQLSPDLIIDGPIQYDAAIDINVARTKAPNSPVAGKATIFVFPDLNTGNNTYKAVQRAADAIAIGPVLQGLNKPVNDLSRGCTVPDIVSTVTITAIQAQAEKGLIKLN